MPRDPNSAPDAPDATKEPRSFEAHLHDLVRLVDDLERGDLGLESALETYEQGVAQLRRCRELLNAAEARIDELLERSDGTPEVRPIESDAASPTRGPNR